MPVDENATGRVYKKLEHINAQYELKLEEVKKEFSIRTTELVSGKEEEVCELQRQLRESQLSEVATVASVTQRHQLELERVSGET